MSPLEPDLTRLLSPRVQPVYGMLNAYILLCPYHHLYPSLVQANHKNTSVSEEGKL